MTKTLAEYTPTERAQMIGMWCKGPGGLAVIKVGVWPAQGWDAAVLVYPTGPATEVVRLRQALERADKWTVSRGWAPYVGRTWRVFDPAGQLYVTAPTFPAAIRIAQRAARHYADPANVYALAR